MVIKTNREEYFNDILEEIKLFLPSEEISLYSKDTCHTDSSILSVTLICQDKILISESAYLNASHIEKGVCPDSSPLVIKRYEKRTLKISVFRLMKKLFNVSTPWGSLTGIRPTKLFRELISRNEDAYQCFLDTYDVSESKTNLAKAIYENQKPYFDVPHNHVDIYIHIPFCTSKCLYCSFPSQILKEGSTELDGYLNFLEFDIQSGSSILNENGYKIRNAYIGGGTPTVLSVKQLDRLLNILSKYYGIEVFHEFTVEAGRPETMSKEKLNLLKDYGIQRISINPQSMNDETLVRIGRLHTVADIIETYAYAKKIGIPVVNMDLIAGLPDEKVKDFELTLNRLSELSPENLTIHTLAIKNASRLKENISQYDMPDVSEVEKMVEMGIEYAKSHSYEPYYMYRQKYMSGNLENIGYAKKNTICEYNIDMMEETTNILSHGAGSMTKRVFSLENRVERIPSPKDFKTYANKLETLKTEKSKLFSIH